jgi:hypothetical protein
VVRLLIVVVRFCFVLMTTKLKLLEQNLNQSNINEGTCRVEPLS